MVAVLVGISLSSNLDQPSRENLRNLKIAPGRYIWPLMGSSIPDLKVTVVELKSFNLFCSSYKNMIGPDVSRGRESCWIFRPCKKVQA